MGSIDLEMDDVFDGRGTYSSDEDVGHTRDSPDNIRETENDDITEKLSKLTKGASRKNASRPQLKLDVDRLKSSRGLLAIPKLFEKIRFRGKGYEAQDLELLMSTLEHWGHRLMPKMPFSELTERLEKLGAKKEVQTCIKRVRLDLPFFGGDVQEDEFEAPNEEAPNVFDDAAPARDDSFVALHDSTNTIDNSGLDDSVMNDLVFFPSTPIHNTPSSSSCSSLTQEQKERVEKNRQLALQRKMQKSLLATPSTPSRILN